jgi:glucose/arabinose dehydrogenase
MNVYHFAAGIAVVLLAMLAVTEGGADSAHAQRRIKLERVLSTHTFDRPVDIQFFRSASRNRVLVVEQPGIIWHLDSLKAAEKTQVIDLSSLLTFRGERGLLGLALHPKFIKNGFFFVNYTRTDDGATVIARFTFDHATRTASLDSRIEFLTVAQPFANHNAGSLVFGKDGFLYIPLGDGGSGGDPLNNAQNGASLLGKILRINVDRPSGDLQYSIPASNPFADGKGGFRPEIFTYGMRNPFKLTMDSETGTLWTGDVGQNRFEEIDIIKRGRNYGWNKVEGKECFPDGAACSTRGTELPVWVYGRELGSSVTGGYVYRGKNLPRLEGQYIYGDFLSGRIWALKRNSERSRRSFTNRELLDTELFISSFGQTPDGEMVVVSYDGAVYRLAR